MRQSSETPLLHAKYLLIRNNERRALKQGQSSYTAEKVRLTEYWSGLGDDDDQPDRVLSTKKEINEQVAKELEKRIEQLNFAEEKVKYVEALCEVFSKRSFHIQNVINCHKFEAGDR